MLPALEAVRDLALIRVAGGEAAAIAHGATFAASAFVGKEAGAGPFAVVNDSGVLLAVYERRGSGVKPAVVLATEAAVS